MNISVKNLSELSMASLRPLKTLLLISDRTLKDDMLINVARRMVSAIDLRELGIIGLEMSPAVIEGTIMDHRHDISEAAYKVLKHWLDSQFDRKEAYKNLCEGFQKIKRPAYIEILREEGWLNVY